MIYVNQNFLKTASKISSLGLSGKSALISFDNFSKEQVVLEGASRTRRPSAGKN
jgi:hypothetical protein